MDRLVPAIAYRTASVLFYRRNSNILTRKLVNLSSKFGGASLNLFDKNSYIRSRFSNCHLLVCNMSSSISVSADMPTSARDETVKSDDGKGGGGGGGGAEVLFLQEPLDVFEDESLLKGSGNPDKKKASRILSVQSHTVHGFVGNKAAVFPMQCFGANVDNISTVVLSNHPGYEKGCLGSSVKAPEVANLITGLARNDLLGYDGILSGYIASKEVLEELQKAIAMIRVANPAAKYFLDPVLGDDGEFYVAQELKDVYRDQMLPLATVVTPNQFEAEVLSGMKINSIQDAILCTQWFHSKGCKICILKGLKLSNDTASADSSSAAVASNSPSSLSIIASIILDPSEGSTTSSQVVYRRVVQRLNRTFSGCGDVFSSLITSLLHRNIDYILANQAHWLLGDIIDIASLLMHSVLLETIDRGSKELCVIESGPVFFRSSHLSNAITCNNSYIDFKKSYQSFMMARWIEESSSKAPSRSCSVHNAHLIYYSSSSSSSPPTSSLSSTTTTTTATTTTFSSSSSSSASSSSLSSSQTKLPLGVIFDMDGTLTEPGAIDFKSMYSRLGIKSGPDADAITHVNSISDPVERAKAHAIIIEEELIGIQKMKIRPDMKAVINALLDAKIRVAISTRNCRAAVTAFLDSTSLIANHIDRQTPYPHHVFYPIIDRDSLNGINKPDPRVALNILQLWDTCSDVSTTSIAPSSSSLINTSDFWFVGDSSDDILCGKAAGCRTCLIQTDYSNKVISSHKEKVDLLATSLTHFATHIGLKL